MNHRERAVEELRRRLANGETLKAVALDLLVDQRSLSRWFKEIHGMAPLNYARLHGTARRGDHVERQRIIVKYRALGESIQHIAQKRLGITGNALRRYMLQHGDELAQMDAQWRGNGKFGDVPKRGATLRKCLACDNLVKSTGPHHRLCDTHRARAHDLSPMEPTPGGHTGRRVQPMRHGR